MPNEKLFVVVMGEQVSGKSITWETLFDRRHRSGIHMLQLNRYIHSRVLLFVSSPQENYWTLNAFLNTFRNRQRGENLDIVLCSLQTTLTNNMVRRHVASAKDIIKHMDENGFDIFIQWLNPGFTSGIDNTPNITDQIMSYCEIDSVIGIRNENATLTPENRAGRLRDVILGWVQSK